MTKKLLYHPSSTQGALSIAMERHQEVTKMSRYEDACPFEPQTRAARCEGCIATNGVPPCAAAFLSGRTQKSFDNVVALRRADAAPHRKAA